MRLLELDMNHLPILTTSHLTFFCPLDRSQWPCSALHDLGNGQDKGSARLAQRRDPSPSVLSGLLVGAVAGSNLALPYSAVAALEETAGILSGHGT